jgi:hypothetical protein
MARYRRHGPHRRDRDCELGEGVIWTAGDAALMGATVTLSRDWSLEDLELITADDMREIGLLQRERMVRRTMGGVDMHGAAFRPYSPAYAAMKGSTFVNLQVSGNMLNHLQITETQAGDGKAIVRLGWLQ